MAWEIRGESGKTLDATGRSLEALNIDTAVLKFQSLARDTFTWTAAVATAAGSGTIVPDQKQAIELWKDGTRRFRGHVSERKIGLKTITITVQGPWWWMEQIDLTEDQTDEVAAVEERVKYIAGSTSDLATKIRGLIDRAITLGVPMIRDTVADMFDTPKLTLSGESCAGGLTSMVSRCPDAVVWFDYSGSTGTAATIKISRRNGAAPMTEKTYTLGTDAVEAAEITARPDLKVSRVVIHYLDRHPTSGKIRYQKDGSGTASTDIAGASETQKLTLSGDELVAFIPLSDFDSVAVKSILWNDITSAIVKARDGGLAGITKSVGAVFGGVASSYTRYDGQLSAKYKIVTPLPGLERVSDTGRTFPSAVKWLITSDAALPEWAQTALAAIRTTITGTWVAGWKDSERGVGTGWNDVFMAMQVGAQVQNNSWENALTVGEAADYRVDWLARPFSVSGWMINAEYATLETIYKPAEFGFPAPPAGMASGMLTAQAWTPWEGPITLVGTECDGENKLRYAFNLAGALAGAATMAAPAKSVSFDLARERITIDLGPPARMDYGSSSGRIPASPQDLIVPV